jgi:hypothetical protein
MSETKRRRSEPVEQSDSQETAEFELLEADLNARRPESKTPNPRDTLTDEELDVHLNGLHSVAKARERASRPDD